MRDGKMICTSAENFLRNMDIKLNNVKVKVPRSNEQSIWAPIGTVDFYLLLAGLAYDDDFH